MKLIPIEKELEENQKFKNNPLCEGILEMTIEFYKRIGFVPPWICYFVELDGQLVGSAGIKGQPVNGQIEIAYGTMEPFQNQGVGTKICRALVELSLKTDPLIRVTARTLPENNYSTKVLKKNNFVFIGTVIDPEDGEVWEWEYQV
jgi:RimJ/RimL family protein N-acetyltransferase